MQEVVGVLTAEIDADAENMLKFVSREIESLGYVKHGYGKALLERERKYPTGLVINGAANVAIPHADIEYSLRPVVVIIKRANGQFKFGRMDDPDNSILVDMVFLLVVEKSSIYVKFLADLIELFQDTNFSRKLKEGKLKSVANLLREELKGYNLEFKGPLVFHGREDRALT